MSIKKRGNLWQIDVSIGGIRHRVTEKTRKAAQEKERELLAQKNPLKARLSSKSETSSPRLRPSKTSSVRGRVVVQ